MPIYVYRCEQCGLQFEKRQSFTDAPLTECETCHGNVRKVLTPTVVIFKGPGFYSTDHNAKSGGNGHKDGDTDGKNGGDAKSESKPATEVKETSKENSKENSNETTKVASSSGKASSPAKRDG